jgi:hypothetical protein
MLSARALFADLGLLVLLAGCGPDVSITKRTVDNDSDGYAAEVDCDDAHADTNPDAPELCDGRDNNCDDQIDQDAEDAPTWYVDGDGDGYGADAVSACDAPEGTVEESGDCDDASAGVYPGADEVCDGVDQDCDDEADEDATDMGAWYADNDGDGYGDGAVVLRCDGGDGFAAADGDCDEGDAAVHPGAAETDCADPVDYNCDGSVGYMDADGDGWAACEECDDGASGVRPDAAEVCDGVDQDCDTVVDDGVTTPFYADDDGDGFGDPASSVDECAAPGGYVADASDCDDGASGVYPGAPETCDDVDEDCDTVLDEGAVDAATWYADLDGDGFGDPSTAMAACDAPADYVADNTDCDDGARGVHPGASETCDGVDEDCDGTIDDAAGDAPTWYADTDGDSFGDAGDRVVACDAPTGYLADDQDCDDALDGVNPDATETCDGVDEDCDGATDEDAADASTWYVDADLDGHGDTTTVVAACDEPAGFTAAADDCDDAEADVYPGATELCDGVDHDCDGAVDEADSVDVASWYRDGDSDGYGAGSATLACWAPDGYVATATDCDDVAASVYPGATEVCDASNTDEDCDGRSDDADTAVSGRSTWYRDADSDTYGGTTTASACDQPGGYVATSTDCDDASAAISPAATEQCDGANTDEDCDGLADDADSAASGRTRWYPDGDSDTYGAATGWAAACDRPIGYTASATDCDDTDGTINPGATEVCDSANTDENCDGTADDSSATGKSTFYADVDGDTYGGTSTTSACDLPSGYVATSTDCDDGSSAINPGAAEVCDSANTDEDCDGTADDSSATGKSTFYADADGDTYGGSTTTNACDLPSGYVATSTDCNDSSAAISPAAAEVCDSADTDEDCDGAADDADSSVTGTSTFYLDADADGFGAASATTSACDEPSGYASVGTDCDDVSADDYPGADEICVDGDDDDCDGVADDGCPSYAYGGTYQLEGSTSDADYVIYGQAAGDDFGMAVASGVDFEGDGYENLIVGSDNDYDSGASYDRGRVYVYNGFPRGVGAANVYDKGSLANYLSAAYHVGSKVWGIEDVNGDGNDELGFLQTGGTYTTYVWEGDRVSSDGAYHLSEYSSQTGGSLSSGGSLVASGGQAWVSGNPYATSYTGVVYVLSGTTSRASFAGEDIADYAGYAVSGGTGMDCDGDGYDDLVIGAYGDDTGASAGGAAYVVLGPVSGSTNLADADLKITGSTAGDLFGYNVMWAGDDDGDGLTDLWVAAPTASLGGSNSGVVSLFHNVDPASADADATDADYGARVYGAAGDILGGYSANGGMAVGDTNGDGDVDLLLGSPMRDVGSLANAGAAWLLYGPFAGSSDIGTAAEYDGMFQGNGASDLCGASVALGDLDADGLDDIIVGCTAGDYSTYSDRGTVWMFLGG